MPTFKIELQGSELDATVQALKMLQSITTVTLQNIDAQAGAQFAAMQATAAKQQKAAQAKAAKADRALKAVPK